MRLWIAGAAIVAAALYSWWLVGVGRHLERTAQAEATAAPPADYVNDAHWPQIVGFV